MESTLGGLEASGLVPVRLQDTQRVCHGRIWIAARPIQSLGDPTHADAHIRTSNGRDATVRDYVRRVVHHRGDFRRVHSTLGDSHGDLRAVS